MTLKLIRSARAVATRINKNDARLGICQEYIVGVKCRVVFRTLRVRTSDKDKWRVFLSRELGFSCVMYVYQSNENTVLIKVRDVTQNVSVLSWDATWVSRILYLISGYSNAVRRRIWVASQYRHLGPTWDTRFRFAVLHRLSNRISCMISQDGTYRLQVCNRP